MIKQKYPHINLIARIFSQAFVEVPMQAGAPKFLLQRTDILLRTLPRIPK
jgi:hypothetical protein